jgi:hypothetical protein
MAKTIIDFKSVSDKVPPCHCHDCDWYRFHWDVACAMCHRFGLEIDGHDPICTEFTTLEVLDPEDTTCLIKQQKVC